MYSLFGIYISVIVVTVNIFADLDPGKPFIAGIEYYLITAVRTNTVAS